MDKLEIKIVSQLLSLWPKDGSVTFEQVEMVINGEPLLDIVRRVESPYAEREFDEDLASRETVEELGARGSLAGDYLYLSPDVVFLPSRNFFGKPYNHCFDTDSDDPVNQKSLILTCTCGITDCWFLVANIITGDDIIIWNNFQQFHRDWTYDLNFVFNRKEYEAEFGIG